jgi:Uma2 family endonuclease
VSTGWQELAYQGNPVGAIKAYRSEYGCGLAEAKSAVEQWLSVNVPPSVAYQNACRIAARTADLLDRYRSDTGCDAWYTVAVLTARAEDVAGRNTLYRAVVSTEQALQLAVEVAMDEAAFRLRRKVVAEHLEAGVSLVWLVDPELRIVIVYRGTMRGVEFEADDTLDGGDVLPGFSCKVSELFA